MAHTFPLNEPVIKGLQAQLIAQMPTTVQTVNNDVQDGFTIVPPVTVYDHVPLLSEISSTGFPAIGIEDMPSRFEDDLVYSVNGVHQLAIVAFIANPVPQALVWQLRRYEQAIAEAINVDRTLGGACWAIILGEIDPGPMLEPRDRPNTDGESTYLSWFGFQIYCKTTEV